MCRGAVRAVFQRVYPRGLLDFYRLLEYITVKAKFDILACPTVHVSDRNKIAWVLEAFLSMPFPAQVCLATRSSVQNIYH